MLQLNLQFFAHKKGVGSTKNGRDSESKRLGAKKRFRVQETWREESRRTVCKGRKHPLQTARNEDSSRRERWTRRR